MAKFVVARFIKPWFLLAYFVGVVLNCLSFFGISMVKINFQTLYEIVVDIVANGEI